MRMPSHAPAADTLHQAMIAAAREFNAGRYFEAHEVIEDALESVPDAEWDAFLGLIQIAVGYHKLTQGLLSGAAKMLTLGLAKVSAFDAVSGGLDVDHLRTRAAADLAALGAGELGPATLARNPPRLRLLRRREG